MFDDVMVAYGKLLKDSDLETDPALAERDHDRCNACTSTAAPISTVIKMCWPRFSSESARPDWPRTSSDPLPNRFAAEVIATVDVEHGSWQGRPVDLPLFWTRWPTRQGNEMTLTRFAERLPNPRSPASRRNGASSGSTSRCRPSTRLRASPAAVRRGGDPATDTTPSSSPITPSCAPGSTKARRQIRAVLVRQRVWQRSATLLGYAQQRPDAVGAPRAVVSGQPCGRSCNRSRIR